MVKWENYRERCLQAKGEQCKFCGVTDEIVAHHVDGDRENHTLKNLIPVCRSCHANIHSRNEVLSEWTKKLPENAMVGQEKGVSIEPYDQFQTNRPTIRRGTKIHYRLLQSLKTKPQVIEVLSGRYQPFEDYLETRSINDLRFKNPRVKDGATLIVSDSNIGGKAVLTLSDTVFIINEDGQCDCGHSNDYTPKEDEVLKRAYNRRRKESCPHEVASLNAIRLGSEQEPGQETTMYSGCSQCGYTAVKEHRIFRQESWVMSEYSCAHCGTTFGTTNNDFT